ncbi:hypothetical protein [Risungbinella massiliensis]|uniref:hypothetical protein n=1 Tax=Risungbinella massiliensis TaxID=1329796 RepID=UPI0005CC4DEA|nr:hypothetical protein [Risungbinella massiliensis]
MRKEQTFIFKGFVSILIMFLLTGCYAQKHEEDYTKIYKQFLNYTLGEWKVVHSGEEIAESYMPQIKYKTWEIVYTDKNGAEQKILIDNLHPISRSLERHLDQVYIKELFKKVTDLPSTYLSDAQIEHQTTSELAYEQNPDKFFDNYKDIYKFKEWSLQSVYENSAMYLTVYYDLRDDKSLTKEEKIAKMEEKEKDILELIPNINLKIEVNEYDGDFVAHYYMNGKRVNPEEQEGYEKLKENGHIDEIYENMLTNRVPQLNIDHLYEE